MNIKVLRGTVGGTRAALSGSSVKTRYVVIKALTANANDVFVGRSDVTTANGFPLDATEEIALGDPARGAMEFDLADIYVIGGASAQAYAVLYL